MRLLAAALRCDAQSARDAASAAEQAIKRKLLVFSVASTAHLINEIDDAIGQRHYVQAVLLIRQLADFMDRIAGSEFPTDPVVVAMIPTPAEWRQYATELREWHMKIRVFADADARRKFDNIEDWCRFTARIKPKVNAGFAIL